MGIMPSYLSEQIVTLSRLCVPAALKRSAALVGLSTVMALTGCGSESSPQPGAGQPSSGGRPAAPRARDVAVVAQPVAFKVEAKRIEAVGTARARQSAVVYPPVGGEVTARLFSAGDYLEKGDVLLTLDARQEKLAVDLAQVSVDEARQLLERYRRIEDTGAISDSQIDQAKTALDGARIRLRQATEALEDRTVRAPFSGYVGLTTVDAGVRITPTTAIAQLDDRSRLFIDFQAPEDAFAALEKGMGIALTSFSSGAVDLVGVLEAVDNRIDATARTFTARVGLDNGADTYRPGMSFQVNFGVDGRSWPAIPEAAISWGSDGAYLWAIADGKASRTPLTIVSRNEGEVLIDADLAPGDLVIVEGVQKVRQGTPVKISRMKEPWRPQNDTREGDAQKVSR